MGFGDFQTALAMRDLVHQMIQDELEKSRPTMRYGVVSGLPIANKASVVFIGDVLSVQVSLGVIRPKVGDYVRVEGVGADRYVTDILGGGQEVALSGGWRTYVPSLTAATTNQVLGTGGTYAAKYNIIGSTCFAVGEIHFGTSGYSFGSGQWLLGLPSPAAFILPNGQMLGSCSFYRTGGSPWYLGIPFLYDANRLQLWGPGSATAPGLVGLTQTGVGGAAWGASAIIRFNLHYETTVTS